MGGAVLELLARPAGRPGRQRGRVLIVGLGYPGFRDAFTPAGGGLTQYRPTAQ